jgi:hypothetical protein
MYLNACPFDFRIYAALQMCMHACHIFEKVPIYAALQMCMHACHIFEKVPIHLSIYLSYLSICYDHSVMICYDHSRLYRQSIGHIMYAYIYS